MTELSMVIQPDGNVLAQNDKLSIQTQIKFGKGNKIQFDRVDEREYCVYYVDFTITALDNSVLREEHVNRSKLNVIIFITENIYNNLFFRSNSLSKPNALYKAVLNVKGFDIKLVPVLELKN